MVVIRAIPQAPGVITNTASVTADQPDPTPANNSATINLTVQPPVPADLVLSAYVTANPVIVGDEVEYDVIVSNFGPNPHARNVVVTTELPKGFTVQEATPSQGTTAQDGQKITTSLGSIDAFANATIRFVLVPSMPDQVAITSSVTSDAPDPNALNNSVRTDLTVQAEPLPDLSTAIIAVPSSPRVGDTVTYTIIAASNGPGIADGVVLTDSLPADAQLLTGPTVSQGTVTRSGDTLTADLGTLAPGQQAILTYTIRATTTGSLTTTVNASASRPDQNPGNNLTTQTTNVASAEAADVAVGIIPVPEPATVNQPLKYTIIAANNGPGTATGVSVRLPLPPGVDLASIRPSQGTASVGPDGVLSADLGSLIPGGRALIELTVIPRVIGPIDVAATIQAAGPDFQPMNNRSSTTTISTADAAAPVVTAQRLIASPRGISAIILNFSRPMNAALAGLPSNYLIRLAGANGQDTGRTLRLRSASYDSTSQSVTLTPAQPLAIGRFYHLAANAPGGPGLVGADGTPLDGDLNGLPDGIYDSLIGRGTHTRPRALQRTPLTPLATSAAAGRLGNLASAFAAARAARLAALRGGS